ncbi:MAG: formimidoylglutamate deiminase [Azospirillaceae bacterium]
MPTPSRAASLHAAHALLPQGWARDVRIVIDAGGGISGVEADSAARVEDTVLAHGVLLPAPANLHSHAFQRAMAGLTEHRSGGTGDDFWSWRRLMYAFLDRLTPEDVEAIAAQVQMEMLEAGYAAVAEFHYLHHGTDGRPYADLAEMAARVAAAAGRTGIGLTLLPVLYRQGGLDGAPLEGGQRRFGCDRDSYADILAGAETALARLGGDDGRVGVAPHSLRAVGADDLAWAAGLRPDRPVHIHIAEQTAEVEAIEAAYGARPVAWLLDRFAVDGRWCLVHATHMTAHERDRLATSGAVAGLCPVTEANLGDGLFDAAAYLERGGAFGVGSDSNVRIDLVEELRLLEYGQRLRHRGRALLASEGRSVGRTLLDAVTAGGARAAGRNSGRIAKGAVADLVALDGRHLALDGLSGDRLLDAWIFAGDGRAVDRVWSAGRPCVAGGRHHRHEAIEAAFRRTMARLRTDL